MSMKILYMKFGLDNSHESITLVPQIKNLDYTPSWMVLLIKESTQCYKDLGSLVNLIACNHIKDEENTKSQLIIDRGLRYIF